MFKERLSFGLLFGIVLLIMFYFDQALSAGWPARPLSFPPGALLALTFAVIIPMAMDEMRKLLARQQVVISMRVCVVAAMLCMLWPWVAQLSEMLLDQPRGASPLAITVAQWFHTVKPGYLVPTVLAVALLGAFLMQSRRQQTAGAMASAGGSLLAIVYLGVLPGFYMPIRLSHSAGMVVSILLIVKGADIGAYGVGRSLGRHRFITWLSPRKSWEGLLGGIASAALIGTLLAHFAGRFAWWQGSLAGILLGTVGQLGDLLESLLKRDAGVKDSGQVPGFGGVLDLLDSPLLAAPVAYWLLKLVHA